MKKTNGGYPPPFLGPAHQEQIYNMQYYQDRNAGVIVPPGEAKSKKSLAEKISRTFDKLAFAANNSPSGKEGERRSRDAYPQPGWVYPVYPGYHPGYGTVRGHHGVNYQYVYGAWDPSVYGGVPSTHEGYADMRFEGRPSGGVPSNGCRCPDSGKESVRSRTGRCKKCNKDRLYGSTQVPIILQHQKSRTKLQIPDNNPNNVRSDSLNHPALKQKQRTNHARDPYDYIRRTKLKADEWDTYWDAPGDHDVIPASLEGKLINGRTEAVVHQQRSKSVAKEEGEKPKGVMATAVIEAGAKKQEKAVLAPFNQMEEEEEMQEEKPIGRVRSPMLEAGVLDHEMSNSPAGSPGTGRSSPSVGGGLENGRESSALFLADLASMKSRMTAAELRYRKFQRRNPLRKLSIQIDEVIMEEDEDALEAESREDSLTSLPPVIEEAKEDRDSSSDDELGGLGKFKKVTVSDNLAEEILQEIYGGKRWEEGAKDADGGEEKEAASRSLADEILDELYGRKVELSEDGDELRDDVFHEDETVEEMLYDLVADDDSDEYRLSASGYAEIENTGEILQSPAAARFLGSLSAGGRGLLRSLSMQKGGQRRLYRSLSLQERGNKNHGLAHLLNDTTRFKLSHRPSLVHLVPTGTPTLHRPSFPPPPPPASTHPLLQPFSSNELLRINEIINGTEDEETNDDDEDDFTGSEFSDDEFDTVEVAYENLPLERPAPEGAEDLPPLIEQSAAPELNESVDEECKSYVLNSSCDETSLLDISDDSLMDQSILDRSFDRDSIGSHGSRRHQSREVSSQNVKNTSGSVIENKGEKTIIVSPGLAAQESARRNQMETSENTTISISSASWINIEGNNEIIKGNVATVATAMKQDEKSSIEEPVKPPRLKKLAREQSKQDILRAKGFGLSIARYANYGETMIGVKSQESPRVRPEISPPILINSTLNPNDLDNHKCISLEKASGGSSEDVYQNQMAGQMTDSTKQKDQADEFSPVYEDGASDTDSSFYITDSVIEETYNAASIASDLYNEHIYEEIPENKHKVRPLPPIPEGALGPNLSKSIFTGATKYEILHYLNDARQRIEGQFIDYDTSNEDSDANIFIGHRNHKHRISGISNLSDSSSSSNDSSSDGGVLWRGPLEKLVGLVDIERNDSGVGSDSGMSSSKLQTPSITGDRLCEDCDIELQDKESDSSNVCKKCSKRRSERKEIITEIVETEIKYGRDLKIIVEEFYRPMLVAGLLSSDQLAAIFLNVEQLIVVNNQFTQALKDGLEIATEQGDDDLCTVNTGAIFVDSLNMLQAFETYCIKQAAASMLLATVEREKELLRVFLKVSQMENKILRRMNLSSFLMVPVQRVTKYPLLLSRLLKVTPAHHSDKDNIKEAQTKIEEALEQMNKDAKEIISTKGTWRRAASGPKKVPIQREMNNIRVRKLSLETLGWANDESRFALEGRLTFAQPTDTNWRKMWKGTVSGGIKLTTVHALLVVTGRPEQPEIGAAAAHNHIIFPKLESVKEAVLLLVREKTSRFSTVRDPFHLEKCVVCCEQDWDDCFEIQEFGTKDSFIFRADDASMTQTWFQTLQFFSQSLGGWRRRRKGLANIMVDPGTG